MRNKFQNFYTQPFPELELLKEIWLSIDTVFIFDTNTLLDLYRYGGAAQQEFFNQLNKIKDNIWMPYHVGLEFHNNRVKVIKQNNDKAKGIDNIQKIISFNYDPINELQKNYKKKDHLNLYNNIDDLKEKLKEKKLEVDRIIEESKLKMKELVASDSDFEPNFLAHKDKILAKLEDVFKDKNIGGNLYDSQEKIEELFNLAKQRWALEIPPGYLDYEEKKDKVFFHNNLKYYKALGDLIIFNEIKEFCYQHKNIKNVFFISNDAKSDWKYITDYEGKKDFGVRHELRSELFNHAENIQFFEIVTSDKFVDQANKISGKTIDKDILQNILNTRTEMSVMPPYNLATETMARLKTLVDTYNAAIVEFRATMHAEYDAADAEYEAAREDAEYEAAREDAEYEAAREDAEYEAAREKAEYEAEIESRK